VVQVDGTLIRVMWVEPKGERKTTAPLLSLMALAIVVLLAYQLPGSNAWNTAKSIKAKWRSCHKIFRRD